MRMNKDLASLIYQFPLKNSGVRYQFVLIENGFIDKEEFVNYLASASSPIVNNLFGIYSAITSRGGKVVGYIDLDKATYPSIGSAPNFNINFQLGRVPISVVASGSPNWFMLYDRVTNSAYNSSGPCMFFMKGTVSDLNGNGDLKISNTTLTLGQTHRALNFKLRHVL